MQTLKFKKNNIKNFHTYAGMQHPIFLNPSIRQQYKNQLTVQRPEIFNFAKI